jgi:hypothetical protein
MRRLFLSGTMALAAVLIAAPGVMAANRFSVGQLQSQTVGATGCGTNIAGEPSIHVSRANNVFLGSENGLGGGSELWRGLGQLGGNGAPACALEYRGQPNAVQGVGASGGDIDIAIASAQNPNGKYNLYVASLNLASVNVATSQDDATTFTQVPVVEGIPVDDREWIAAFGAGTALLSYHDIATNDIDILRSDDAGQTFVQESQAIPATDYRASNNELGNLVIDHRNLPAGGGFWAYQSYVAPSSSSGSHFNEAFVAASSDGGARWTQRPIPCSTASTSTDLDHNFPNVSVDPEGNLWYAWSDDKSVRVAESTNHGASWACSGPIGSAKQSIFPWLSAGRDGEDLVFYGTSDAPGPNQLWSAYFAQNLTKKAKGWGGATAITSVHKGTVCEGGINCTSGRQLFDDFGVDVDSAGWAHVAYSHDSPALGGSGTYTGAAVQTSGNVIGPPNN